MNAKNKKTTIETTSTKETASTETETTEAAAKPEAKAELAPVTRIDIKPIQVQRFRVRIRGISDLIVHGWGKKALAGMLAQQQMTKEEKRKAKDNREKKDPKSDFEEAKYIVNGKDCFPTSGLKKSLVTAAYVLGIPKNAVRQAIFIEGDYFEIHHERCVMREDTVRVGVFPKFTADIRYRPAYQNWWAEFQVAVRADLIDVKNTVALFQNAGFSVGIGEWRPEKDGSFGQFEVVGSQE